MTSKKEILCQKLNSSSILLFCRSVVLYINIFHLVQAWSSKECGLQGSNNERNAIHVSNLCPCRGCIAARSGSFCADPSFAQAFGRHVDFVHGGGDTWQWQRALQGKGVFP
jgi:hypothetical protein